jgi:predicted RNA-binding Zn-ribbon protein involved in translation (DUF1610 family)
MAQCTHKELLLLTSEQREMVRCTRCHLLIGREELGGRHCPECLEQGKRHAVFEKAESAARGNTRYRCELCGALIECD